MRSDMWLNKALQRTASVHHRCNPGFSGPPSLSLVVGFSKTLGMAVR
jgi:hypothetical protein